MVADLLQNELAKTLYMTRFMPDTGVPAYMTCHANIGLAAAFSTKRHNQDTLRKLVRIDSTVRPNLF
jgi:hypothetical protein